MPFPDSLLRGIPNKTFLIGDGSVGSDLFYFHEKESEQPRSDGCIEQSINWEDEAGALALTLAQRKDNGEVQFKAGAVRIPREELDRLAKRPVVTGLLSYERKPVDGNKYHGNLLIPSNVPSRIMKTLAAGIALAVSEIIPPSIQNGIT